MKTIVRSRSPEWRLKIRLGIHANSGRLANLGHQVGRGSIASILGERDRAAPGATHTPMVDVLKVTGSV